VAKEKSIPEAQLKKIRNEYLTAEKKVSVRKLAEKFGVNQNALERAATEGRWKELRRKTCGKTAEKLPEKLAEKVSSKVADELGEEIAGRILAHKTILKDALDRLKTKADGTMTIGTLAGPIDIPFLNSPKDIKAWVDAVAKVVDAEREVLGLNRREGGKRPDDEDFDGALWDGADDAMADDRP
jgi:DNA-binding transcriptional regulator YhcF (GntR family)